jgi:hypothetical protein
MTIATDGLLDVRDVVACKRQWATNKRARVPGSSGQARRAGDTARAWYCVAPETASSKRDGGKSFLGDGALRDRRKFEALLAALGVRWAATPPRSVAEVLEADVAAPDDEGLAVCEANGAREGGILSFACARETTVSPRLEWRRCGRLV